MSASFGVREAKARLSEIVDRVRRGQRITLTYRGRGVAQLVPLAESAQPLADRVAELERAGLVDPAPTVRVRGLARPVLLEPRGIARRHLAEDRGHR